ncbi:MAG: EamA family transporter [Mesorhizobium sp.]|nr:MAG: EamA family transporter [Mesorhizobium sp.]
MSAELKSKSELTRATIMLSVGMALSGTAGLFSVSTGQPTFNVVFFRCLFGAAALTGWVCLRGGWKDLFSIERKLWPLVLVSGVCLVINWLALFEAFHRTSIGFATIIYHLQPFWIVLAGGLLLGEALSRHKIAWLWLAFVGLVLAKAWGHADRPELVDRCWPRARCFTFLCRHDANNTRGQGGSETGRAQHGSLPDRMHRLRAVSRCSDPPGW